jgi:Flp pilus assembly protein protease CpaA
MSGSDIVWTALFVIWAGTAAWMDLRLRRVWWGWFIVGGLAAGIYRLVEWIGEGFAFDQILLIAAVMSAAFQLWRAGVWGGADAKTAMIMILVSPDWRMVLVLALVDLVVILGWVLARGGLAGLSEFGRRVRSVLRSGEAESGAAVPLVAVMTIGYWVYLLLFKIK